MECSRTSAPSETTSMCALPSRDASQVHNTPRNGPESPLSYHQTHDHLTGITSGIFDQCQRTNTCPKIVHTMSDIEYWEASGAGDTTESLGRRDLELPQNVRIYEFSSTQHGGFSPVAPLPT